MTLPESKEFAIARNQEAISKAVQELKEQLCSAKGYEACSTFIRKIKERELAHR